MIVDSMAIPRTIGSPALLLSRALATMQSVHALEKPVQKYARCHGDNGQYTQPHFRQIGYRGFYTQVGAWCIVS